MFWNPWISQQSCMVVISFLLCAIMRPRVTCLTHFSLLSYSQRNATRKALYGIMQGVSGFIVILDQRQTPRATYTTLGYRLGLYRLPSWDLPYGLV